jgi:hypothetical protein
MRIIEEFKNVANAIPKAGRALQNLKAVPTYHELYGVRHPFAAYNVSLMAVARRILNVLEALSKTQLEACFLDNKSPNWEVPLLESTDHMLDALMEHLDDCGGIIRSFFPSSEDRRFKKILTEYKNSVEPYRKHIGRIVNYIKHNQGRLRSVSFSWSGGSSLGYFVEGPISGGGLGPVAEIHPTENTAFSFYRDIPFHICNVFAVGARLATALHLIDKSIVLADISAGTETQKTDWAKVLAMASDLPRTYFPDEIYKHIPFIQVKDKRALVEYPSSRVKVHGPPPGSRISVSYHGDGVTCTFKVPYFNVS